MDTILHGISIAQGLEELHSLSIIHMDLKPEHVLSTEAGHVVLAEFGSACVASRPPSTIHYSQLRGAVHYMAPEKLGQLGHITSDESITPMVDIWSLGCILIAMLTGKPPMHDRTMKQIRAAVSRGDSERVGLSFLTIADCSMQSRVTVLTFVVTLDLLPYRLDIYHINGLWPDP